MLHLSITRIMTYILLAVMLSAPAAPARAARSIDTSTPAYPAANPWLESAKLTASDGNQNDQFGSSVAVSGDVMVVGTDNDNSAYVFVKSPDGWENMTQVAKLTISGAPAQFGRAVAISGDVIVVGDECDGYCNGAVYVFVKPSTGWTDMTQTAKLTASDAAINDHLGESVSIDSDVVVAGSKYDDNGRGAVYVFVKPGAVWANMTQTAKLTTSDSVQYKYLGKSVSISGGLVVSGAPGDNNYRGAAYLFIKPPTGWVNATQAAKLTASDGVSNDYFGASVATNGFTVVVGAGEHDHLRGAAYTFVEPIFGWIDSVEQGRLTASDGQEYDYFGGSVAISGNVVVVGAWLKNEGRGAAYVFARPGGDWIGDMTESARLTGSAGQVDDRYGDAVAISGSTIVVGAPVNGGSGAAYVVEQKPYRTYLPLAFALQGAFCEECR